MTTLDENACLLFLLFVCLLEAQSVLVTDSVCTVRRVDKAEVNKHES